MTESGRSAWAAAGRFVLAGGFNTAVTGAALAGLSLLIDPAVAYALVFVGGIGLSTLLADRFVYAVKMSRGDRVTYALMYVAVFVVGLVCVQAMRGFGWPSYTSGGVVLVTAPLTFLGGLIITRRRGAKAADDRGDKRET
ncbi:MAG: GtrA family protein [Propionibacteriaceae bacterium]|jgi:putative flippase GtrA|nr:GtrA family protein [Propionibacteriaceae bacterium]